MPTHTELWCYLLICTGKKLDFHFLFKIVHSVHIFMSGCSIYWLMCIWLVN